MNYFRCEGRTLVVCLLAMGFIFLFGFSVAAQGKGQGASFPIPKMAKPSLLTPVSDPVFGTTIKRISDGGALGLSGICPNYSKRQAFNSDQKRLLLQTCDGKFLLFDGATFKFQKVLEGVGGDDVFWDPQNPDIILFVNEATLMSLNVTNDEKKDLFTFKGYSFADTKGEGNLSLDGRFYAVAGRMYDEKTGTVTFKDFLLLDIKGRQIIAKHSLPPGIENFDWISISPKGNYVVVDYADEEKAPHHGVEVYDAGFKLLWQKPVGAGHSDLGLDANGDEVLVMDRYDAESNRTYIKKFRLADGTETSLLDLSPLFDLHISCRNVKQPGWCLISTFDYVGRLTHTPETFLPFEDEVFALQLNGSGATKRLAHHHSRRFSPQTPDSDKSVYYAEPHATINPEGTRILFGSNWEERVESEKSIETYLLELK